jgi:hypothetical protein
MSDRQLSNGQPVPADDSHKEIDPQTGMQRGYVVLTAEERSKGFVNPCRDSYVHTCGTVTRMGRVIAETYARDPWFYNGTFCVGCGAHFPLDQFHWDRDGEPLDPLKWSPETFDRVRKAKAALRPSQAMEEAEC